MSPATLRDLCPDDKAKVAKLIKQVVELGGEVQRLKAVAASGDGDGRAPLQHSGAAAVATGAPADERLRQLQDTNRQVISHNITCVAAARRAAPAAACKPLACAAPAACARTLTCEHALLPNRRLCFPG